MKKALLLTLLFLFTILSSHAEGIVSTAAEDIIQAAHKLNDAKGLYNLTKTQEKAMKDLRKASKMSLKAAELRSKAEKMQSKADALIEKAKQNAISNGISFTVNDGPLKMTPETPTTGTTQSASADPNALPGQPVNVYIPPNNQTATNYGFGAPVPTGYR